MYIIYISIERERERNNLNNENQIMIIFSRIDIYWHNITKIRNYLSTEGLTSKMSLTVTLAGFPTISIIS